MYPQLMHRNLQWTSSMTLPQMSQRQVTSGFATDEVPDATWPAFAACTGGLGISNFICMCITVCLKATGNRSERGCCRTIFQRGSHGRRDTAANHTLPDLLCHAS